MISLSQVTTDFAAAMRAAGIEPPDAIEADGELHRFSVNGERGRRSGAYRLHLDGRPAGWFQSWKIGAPILWRADTGAACPMTADESRSFRHEVAEQKKVRDAKRLEGYAKAAEIVRTRWEGAEPADLEHPYLRRKGIQQHGIRQSEGLLLVPMHDADGVIHSLQTIDSDGVKLNARGGRTGGLYHAIGKPAGTVIVCEGYATGATLHEATGHAVAVAFACGNLRAVVDALRAKWPDTVLIVAADDDASSEGNPGLRDATAAAHAVGGLLAVPDFGDERPAKATDFNDLHNLRGLEAVRACVEAAKAVGEAVEAVADAAPRMLPNPMTVELSDVSRSVAELAALPRIAYDRAREAEAKRLKIRVSTLDSEVEKLRPAKVDGKAGMFPAVEAWPVPVEGAALLDDVRAEVARFIVCSPEVRTACALWVAFTWLIDRVSVAPLAVITAPEPRCGKSNLLDLIGRLSLRPLVASNVSPAAVYRAIEAHCPTLLIDEADSFMKENEELRGVINSGHTRASAYVIRTVGDDHEPKQFSTWGAKALSGIGRLPQTIMDRALVLELRRKLKGERVAKLRHADPEDFERLRRKLARFAGDEGETIERARPAIPESLNDRAADNWEPLLAIADAAGGQWPSLARTAALNLSGAEQDPLSLSAELLADVRAVFDRKATQRISSADLLAELCEDDEAPWATYNRGKAMTPRQLSGMLRGYGITSKNVRIGYEVPKGFEVAQFADVFSRYLLPDTPLQPATPLHASNGAGFGVADEGSESASPSSIPLRATTRPSNREARDTANNPAPSVACSGSGEHVAEAGAAPATLEPAWNKACSDVAEGRGGLGQGAVFTPVTDPERF
jgi:putative DNA primase/helicase